MTAWSRTQTTEINHLEDHHIRGLVNYSGKNFKKIWLATQRESLEIRSFVNDNPSPPPPPYMPDRLYYTNLSYSGMEYISREKRTSGLEFNKRMYCYISHLICLIIYE
jgi:hypothetical protein